jgi:hypothetical protein
MTLAIEGDSLELDHAEAGILLAGVHAIHGLLTLYLSYDIDVDYRGSYDYIQSLSGLDTVENFAQLSDTQRDGLNKAAEILSPSSPFLAVRPAWQSRLAGVDDEIRSALNILKEAVGSIANESDGQDNDLVHLCAVYEEGFCISPSKYAEGKDIIDSVRKYMDQPLVIEIPGIDTTISVNFAAYFSVQDYKKMLPYYGFYDATAWSDAKPVLFFKNGQGAETGNIMDLIQIAKDADELDLPIRDVVAQIRAIVHLQDPTFQGFLPGATENDVWNLVIKLAERDTAEPDYGVYKTTALSPLKPDFALSLLGK